MWISQFHSIFVQKVFGHSAFDRLPIFQLEGKTLHLCRFPCDVAYSIFSTHCSAMSDFNLQTFDFFGELDTLRVGQGFTLLRNVSDIQDFAHEVNDRLS